jgi:hypothetical protein
MKSGTIIIAFILLLVVSCRKRNQTEVEKLPAETQTGANTFGCLINEVAWTPSGGGIFDRVLTVIYDPTFQGGSLSIRAKRMIANGQTTSITLNGDSINTVGSFPLFLHSKFVVVHSDQVNCSFHTYYDTPTSGVLNITKFDMNARIISGTYSFVISTTACGTIKATEGRFDVKF